MKNRTRKTAQQLDILPQLTKLEKDLLSISGVVEVDFDLDNLYDGLHQVIFLTHYNIPVSADDYFQLRRNVIHSVLTVAALNGLTKTEDTIEDYGEWFYFVFRCGPKWEKSAFQEHHTKEDFT